MPTTVDADYAVEWPDIFQEGVLVDLDISFWSGRKKLNLPELGIQTKSSKDAKRFKDLFSLGTKRLMPKDRMDKFTYLANHARSVLDRYSLKFPVGKSRFVPQSTLADLIAELEEIRAQWEKEVAKFLEDYPKLRMQMLDKYEDHAFAIWDKYEDELRQKYKDNDDGSMNADEKFVDHFMKPIEIAYPGKKKIAHMFDMDWHFFTIAAPTIPGVGEDQTNKINGFLDHVVLSLREEVTAYFEHVAGMIENKQRFTERTVKALRDKIDRFKKLNFLADGEVDAQLATLENDYLKGTDAKTLRGSTEQMDALKEALKACSEKIHGAGPIKHPRWGALGARRFAVAKPGEDADDQEEFEEEDDEE
jgi:hypothetical protein